MVGKIKTSEFLTKSSAHVTTMGGALVFNAYGGGVIQSGLAKIGLSGIGKTALSGALTGMGDVFGEDSAAILLGEKAAFSNWDRYVTGAFLGGGLGIIGTT